MKPGIYHKFPKQDYLAAVGTNKTALDWLRISPLDYREYLDGKLGDSTPETELGNILHAAILENKHDFVTQPDTYESDDGPKKWNGNAAVCKQWKQLQNKTVLNRSDAELVLQAQFLARNDPFALKLLISGESEVTMFARDESKRLLKGRPDWMGSDYFVDLKSTTDATTEAFGNEIYRRRYHIQAALYLRIAELLRLPHKRWFFIILQKGNRPRLNVRELHESALDLGRCELDDDLELLSKCEASGNWYGYSGPSEDIQKIDVPMWAHQKYASRMEFTSGGKPMNF